jgi:hypothetical protein
MSIYLESNFFLKSMLLLLGDDIYSLATDAQESIPAT